jgi:hypothetical protein
MFDADYVQELIEKDLLPFKAMFYLSVESENYDKAEIIRRSWIGQLQEIKEVYVERDIIVPHAVNYHIDKLTSVVGLTDSMLVKLRKELSIALKENNWDDAQKIQNIIALRVKELRPSVTQQIVVGQSGSRTIVQQPSTQHIKVERIPRYGAEDVGRAMSLLQGRGGRLTGKQTGALKFLDILMKR